MTTYAPHFYLGDGSTTDRNVTFSYLSQSTVKVTLDGTLTTAYEWLTATSIRFDTAPLSDVRIKIYRDTAGESVTWASGATILGRDLNKASLISRYIAEEAVAENLNTLGTDASNAYWDAESKRLANLATPTAANDATPKSWVEDLVDAEFASVTVATAADRAAVAADKATVAADKAIVAQHKVDAEAAATSAAASVVAAASAFDSFDDRFLGDKASDPAVDNDGNALIVGALYFNTVLNKTKVWSGSSWGLAYNDTAAASAVLNDSAVSGATVKDALETLNTGKAAVNGSNITGRLAANVEYPTGAIDLNAFLSSGFYRVNASITNGPGSVDYGSLIVSRGGDVALQIASDISSGKIAWRSGSGIDGSPSWGAWRDLIHDGNLSTKTAGKANLAGGNSFTGTETNTFTVSSGSNTALYGVCNGASTGSGVRGDSVGANYGVQGVASNYHSVGGIASGGWAGLIGYKSDFSVYGMISYGLYSFDGIGLIRNAGLIESTSGGFKFPDGSTQTTAATSSPIKAWVNFNGSGTVAIRASSNVTSITDNGIGDYTVNFTTALANANYAVIGNGSEFGGGTYSHNVGVVMTNATTPTVKTTSACRIFNGSMTGGGTFDAQQIYVAFLL